MDIMTDIMRFVGPVAIIVILSTCVISLFRNRPRVHKLAQLVNVESGEVIDIDHWETSIGKSKANDICIPLPSVSRFHAVLSKKSKEWTITDTNSHVGVLVNEQPIDQVCGLEDGDEIQIGSVRFLFECQEALSHDKKTKIRNQVGQNNMQGKRTIAYGVLVDVKTHRPVYLKKENVLIGRSDNADIQIKNPTISSQHARIHRTSKGWALSDLDSHNGTKLNGRYIDEPQLIFDEDMITFGDKAFIFYDK